MNEAKPASGFTGPSDCYAFFVQGWARATRVPNPYRRYGQLACERLYGRLRTAKERQNLSRHNIPICVNANCADPE